MSPVFFKVVSRLLPFPLHGKTYAVRLPKTIEVSALLIAVSEALVSLAQCDVLRHDMERTSDSWKIWTENGSRRVDVIVRGELVFVVGVKFRGDLAAFLQDVSQRLLTVQKFLNDERAITQRIEIPQEVRDSAATYIGRHLTVGTDPRLVPPPLPGGPILTPVPQRVERSE